MAPRLYGSRWRSLGLLAGAALLLAAPTAGRAQPAQPVVITSVSAGSALRELARQTGVNILFTDDAVTGVRVTPLKAKLTPEEAARRLLAGTDLEVIKDPNGALLIRRRALLSAPVGKPRKPDVQRVAYREGVSAELAAQTPPPAPESSAGAAPSAPEVGEVVVTARRVAERLQDVPEAITALSAANLQSHSIQTAQDLQLHVPGLVATAQVGGSTAGYTIRGQTNGLNCLQFCAVVPYLNDVPYAHRFPTFFDIDSVQVLKGPQGVAFGRNTTGGAILVNTRMPSNEYGGYIDIAGGNLDYWHLQGAINVPISDKIAVRAAFDIARRRGYTHELTFNQDLDDIHTDNYRLTVTLRPTDYLQSTFIAGQFRDNSNGEGDVLIAVGGRTASTYTAAAAAKFGFPFLDVTQDLALQQARGPRVVAHSLPSYQHENRWYVQNQTQWKVSDDFTIKNIASVMQWWSADETDTDGSPAPIQDTLLFDQGAWRQVTEELQFQAKAFDQAIRFVGGFYTERTDALPNAANPSIKARTSIVFAGPPGMAGTSQNQPSLSGVSPFNAALGYGTPANQWTSSYALYGQFDIKLDPLVRGLTLTLGARDTWDTLFDQGTSPQFIGGNFTGGNALALLGGDPYPFPLNPPPPTCVIPGGTVANCVPPTVRRNFGGWNYAGTLSYRPNDSIMLYLTSRHGYRAGTFNNPQLTSQVEIPPEKVLDVELGAKADYNLGEIRSRTDIALYNQWYSDMQETVTIVDPVTKGLVTIITSAAASIIRGVELEQTFTLPGGFKLEGFTAYTDAHYTSITSPTLAAQFGSRLPFTPLWQYGVTASYRFSNVGPFGEIIPSITYTGRSNVAFQPNYRVEPESVLPGFGLLDARLEFNRIGGTTASLALFVNNLTDKVYTTGGNFALSSAGYATGFYGPPRTFGAELRYTFGGG